MMDEAQLQLLDEAAVGLLPVSIEYENSDERGIDPEDMMVRLAVLANAVPALVIELRTLRRRMCE